MRIFYKKEGWKFPSLFLLLLVFLLFQFISINCSKISKVSDISSSPLKIEDISNRLPVEDLWRQNITLDDIDNDGFIDIIAPPPRKAEGNKNRPYIFLWDEKNRVWREGNFVFPEVKYSYGGIASGDFNKDGLLDIAIAMHSNEIKVFLRKGNAFVDGYFPVDKRCQSRAIEAEDIDGDGWPDLVVLSEFNFSGLAKRCGIVVALNKNGNEWDIKTIPSSEFQFGDRIAVGDVNGDGKKDIMIAPQCRRDLIKPLWLYDGDNFEPYKGDLFIEPLEDVILVRAGDLDGDNKDEIVYKVASPGSKGKSRLLVLKWNGNAFNNISNGLESIDSAVLAFDIADIDNDIKKEIIIITNTGLQIYKFDEEETKWRLMGKYNLKKEYLVGIYDLKVKRNRDGSSIIVFNQGKEDYEYNGIRAFRLIWKGK